jgi:hypothetical protein
MFSFRVFSVTKGTNILIFGFSSTGLTPRSLFLDVFWICPFHFWSLVNITEKFQSVQKILLTLSKTDSLIRMESISVISKRTMIGQTISTVFSFCIFVYYSPLLFCSSLPPLNRSFKERQMKCG